MHLLRSNQSPPPTLSLTQTTRAHTHTTHAVTMGRPNSTSNPTPNPSAHSRTTQSQYGETRPQVPPHPPTHRRQHGDIRPLLQPNHHPPPPPNNPSQPSPNNRTNTRTHNINILQLNKDSIRNKIEQLTHFMHTNNIHIALLQETKLRQTHKTPAIKHYTPLRRDKRQGEGGGLITLIHHTIRYTDTTDITQNLNNPDITVETQSIRISTRHTQYINIINIYIPPDTSPTVPRNYIRNLHQLGNIPNTIIAEDFNAEDTTWYDHNKDNTRGTHISTQFNNMSILNNTEQYTHIPHQAHYHTSSPDITFCSPTLEQNTTRQTVYTLPADHLPIIITTRTRLTPTPHRITHTNYERANWPSFMEQREQQFLVFNSIPITNIDTSIAQFNYVITNADKAHIPRGNMKHYNPNFTLEIGRLVKERDKNSILPFPSHTI